MVTPMEPCSKCISAWILLLENLIDEFTATEDLELLRLLASANEARGDIQLFLDSDGHASLA